MTSSSSTSGTRRTQRSCRSATRRPTVAASFRAGRTTLTRWPPRRLARSRAAEIELRQGGGGRRPVLEPGAGVGSHRLTVDQDRRTGQDGPPRCGRVHAFVTAATPSAASCGFLAVPGRFACGWPGRVVLAPRGKQAQGDGSTGEARPGPRRRRDDPHRRRPQPPRHRRATRHHARGPGRHPRPCRTRLVRRPHRRPRRRQLARHRDRGAVAGGRPPGRNGGMAAAFADRRRVHRRTAGRRPAADGGRPAVDPHGRARRRRDDQLRDARPSPSTACRCARRGLEEAHRRSIRCPAMDDDLARDVEPYRGTESTLRLPLDDVPYELFERVLAAMLQQRRDARAERGRADCRLQRGRALLADRGARPRWAPGGRGRSASRAARGAAARRRRSRRAASTRAGRPGSRTAAGRPARRASRRAARTPTPRRCRGRSGC